MARLLWRGRKRRIAGRRGPPRGFVWPSRLSWRRFIWSILLGRRGWRRRSVRRGLMSCAMSSSDCCARRSRPSGGREFKNTGDGLFVAFSSASAAVSCAVLTQQLFERRYRGAEQRLHVRIGMGTGEATVKDGDYFGMPSIEAARLCDQAPADGILVSPMTRMAAGRVQGARFESVGELELKGIPGADGSIQRDVGAA